MVPPSKHADRIARSCCKSSTPSDFGARVPRIARGGGLAFAAIFSIGSCFTSCATHASSRTARAPIAPARSVPIPAAQVAKPAEVPHASEVETGAPAAKAASGNSLPIHGSLTSTYRGRFAGSDRDHDLSEVLTLDANDPEKGEWTAHLMTRLNADLDGRQNGAASRFHDLYDVDGHTLVAHVYDAWFEVRDAGPLERLRVGRQTVWDAPVFAWFDGASASTPEKGARRLRGGMYGGVPVRLYGSASSGDALAGVFGEARPWKSTRVRLDWMRFEEDSLPDTDDLWRASAWQSLGKEVRVDGWFTGLEDEERDYQARVLWNDVESGFTFSATWFELLRTQKELAPEIDPFFTTLFELFPYRQARVLASKPIGEHVNVQLGVDTREVDDASDVGRFNRDFDREFATITVSDVVFSDLDVSVTGENWNGAGSDIQTWGFDVTRRFGRELRASIGSYFALFKVDSFLVDERDHVRTAYARLRWHRTSSTTWDLRYEVEDTDDDTFHFVRAGLTWAF